MNVISIKVVANRKKPIKHIVKEHIKNNKTIRSYSRGNGKSIKTKSKIIKSFIKEQSASDLVRMSKATDKQWSDEFNLKEPKITHYGSTTLITWVEPEALKVVEKTSKSLEDYKKYSGHLTSAISINGDRINTTMFPTLQDADRLVKKAKEMGFDKAHTVGLKRPYSITHKEVQIGSYDLSKINYLKMLNLADLGGELRRNYELYTSYN
jgi:hypothetical protein